MAAISPKRIHSQMPRRSSSEIGIEVRKPDDFTSRERKLLRLAHLCEIAPLEAWRAIGTNRQLAYGTHGVFRFFGKFPPLIARHLMTEFTCSGDWVLDPMIGSGTTAVEAVHLQRNIVGRDISPLSLLLTRVKTTHVPLKDSQKAFAHVEKRYARGKMAKPLIPLGLRNADHWFLPSTLRSLGRLCAALESEKDVAIRDLLLTAFASSVRRVSKATTQQGRLFLDVKKAKPDAWQTFAERFEKYSRAVDMLSTFNQSAEIHIEKLDARTLPQSSRRFRLAITHPPYFNNYKYSSINALELAWLGYPPKEVRAGEIRESFKVGKTEKVREYIEDLSAAILTIEQQLEDGGVLALMMGDTIIRDSYIDVTRQLLHEVSARGSRLQLDRIVVRVPQYTEASWVASQRRTGDKIAVTLHDFVLILSKRSHK